MKKSKKTELGKTKLKKERTSVPRGAKVCHH
jgi:hypothetical protein